MKKAAAPTNMKELRAVLGIANYFRDYISKFVSIVSPLTNLTKKENSQGDPTGKARRRGLSKIEGAFS